MLLWSFFLLVQSCSAFTLPGESLLVEPSDEQYLLGVDDVRIYLVTGERIAE